ncbi:transposase [Pseudarthrobacter sp. N5]|uniref:transposase n=1 Tax=Pseudarthrobacter sp. N5 TaxID=3418416 RepID=UPI003CEA5533
MRCDYSPVGAVRHRCASAGIPATRKFATKPELAITMITRALDARVPAAWVTGDAVYGQHAKLLTTLQDRNVSYVLAVPMNQRVIAKTGTLCTEFRADELIASPSGRAWRTRSGGAGSKDDSRYAWARARINGGNDPHTEHWLLAKAVRDRTGQLRSEAMDALAPAHHPVHARPRLPDRHPGKKGALIRPMASS